MDVVFQYVDDHIDRLIGELQRLCRQPSVAAQDLGMAEMAGQIVATLQNLGAEVQVVPTGGYPVVLGTLRGGSDRTLLFYNHYDVQPPEPLEKWDSPPFAAEIRDGKLFARGVSDNKGQFLSRVHAVRALLETRGALPCTVKFLVEGEEEIGSLHLAEFAESHRDLWKADGCLWESGYVDEDDRPMARLGYKGMLYVELRAKGANSDFHSRQAPTLPNPAWELVQALATLRASDGRVLIPGFYDGVLPISEAEERVLAAMPANEAKLLARAGLSQFPGGISAAEAQRKLYTEPTCTICGLVSGYTGKGKKTIVPCEALAKLDLRLVPEQDPYDIYDKLVGHLRRSGFGHLEVRLDSAMHPHKTPVDSPLVCLLHEAARLVYGQPLVVEPTSPATSPMAVLSRVNPMPMAGIGVGWQGSNNHAPNENLRIEDYRRGVKHVAAVIDRFPSFSL